MELYTFILTLFFVTVTVQHLRGEPSVWFRGATANLDDMMWVKTTYFTLTTTKCFTKEDIANLHLLNLSEVCVFAVGEHRARFVELSFDLCALIVQHWELRLQAFVFCCFNDDTLRQHRQLTTQYHQFVNHPNYKYGCHVQP